MTRVTVLGASGMLGHHVCREFAARGMAVTGTFRRRPADYGFESGVFDGVERAGPVDVLAEEALDEALSATGPSHVVNCVGLVKQLEEAEDPCLAVSVNSLLPHRLARWCEDHGAHLIHVSTDCVFAGDRGGYRESDPLDAQDLYGRSKALGETLPSEAAAVTLRTSFIGHELTTPKHGLVEWFLAQAGGRVEGYDGVVYSGLTADELARVIADRVASGRRLAGVYQVASRPITKYALLCLLRDAYGIDVEIDRVETPVADRSLIMDSYTHATGYVAPSWPEMIRRMASERNAA